MAPLGALRYAIDEVRANHDDPVWWRDRIAQRILAPVQARHPGYDDAVDVMAADWDSLLVLDGCRADLFEAEAELGAYDDYRRVVSAGSMTEEWVEHNFAGGSHGDTVYVSANPYVSMAAGDAFHELVAVWEDHFDEAVGTVRPEAVAAAARDAHERFPDKRLIVHFMQPHYPFLDHPELRMDGWDPDRMQAREYGDGDGPSNVWQALALGRVDRDAVWDGYRANLRAVLGPAGSLREALDGRTVVTADHGNLLGERGWPVPVRLYGHPPGLRQRELVEVPWAVADGPRRRVTDEGTRDRRVEADEAVAERLADLGYA